ncbi:hypothetical protein LSAT2_002707 [Lamellibrachia satsuma]|nr:hypothetical protein LSAT2_002707 [Lamellibrachia satsuma]
MRQHSIIYREPDDCWQPGRAKQRRDVTSGHLYKLWPFTNTTAQVRVLNAKYEGPPSERLVFHTREGVPERVQRFRVLRKGPTYLYHYQNESNDSGFLRKGPTYLYLAWDPPDVVNGILIGFTIVYQELFSQQISHRYLESRGGG